MTTLSNRSKVALWSGRIISILLVLFFLFDSSIKVLKLSWAVEGTMQLGYPENTVIGIGIALLTGTILYVIPRTAVLGAILLTGYLGGAVATQVRVEDPWFLFPVVFGILVWVSLYLRDKVSLRTLILSRKSKG